VLAEIASRDRTVIATGGGCVIRAANRKLLRERTRCVYLHTSADILFERLRGDRKRPLLQVADPLRRLRELGDARDPLYREVAIITIETGRGSSHAAVASIAAQLLSASDDPADAGGSSR
jgi:shikimate kinase